MVMSLLHPTMMGSAQSLGGLGQLLQPQAAPQSAGMSIWDKLLDPEVALPAAAAMMQAPDLGSSIGGAFAAYGKGAAERKKRNQTMDFLRSRRPDLLEAVQAGMAPADAFKLAFEGKERQALMNAGNGKIYDPNNNSWITAPGGGEGFRQATPEEAARYGSQAGQFGPDGRFYAINPPQGMAIESDGQGGFRMVQGAGAGTKFTEAQTKDNVYSTRAEGALTTLDRVEGSLMDRTDKALDWDPTGLARGQWQSPDYQVAKTAGDEFLQAILRKDTGAAITAPEQELYGKTYLPQPGDTKEVRAYKKEARRRAIEAIKAGMSPAQIVAQERAIAASGNTRSMQELTDDELEAIANGE